MIVITGASDGLGLEVAKLYKAAGKTVVNISRKESEAADINICLSLCEGPEIEEAAKQVLVIDEPLEALINCIGIFTREDYGDITEDEIKRAMSSNAKPLLLLTSKLIEKIEADGTDILNVTSSASRKGCVSEPVYSASKWAARGITKGLQERFKGKPNRVIDFCPGGMTTDFFEKSKAKYGSTDGFMKPSDVALALKQTLDLPKNMEVSEIIVNRK